MALPKKELTENLRDWGIPEENLKTAVDYILNGNSESLDVFRTQLDTANNRINTLQKAEDDYKRVCEELETLKQSNGNVATIQQEFDSYKAAVEAEKLNATKTRLVRKALLDEKANPKAVDLMLRGIDLTSVKLDGDGESAVLIDTDAVVKPYKDSYPEWFGTDITTGVPPINPPSGGAHIVTKDSIMKIKDTSERQKAIAEHLDMFGKQA